MSISSTVAAKKIFFTLFFRIIFFFLPFLLILLTLSHTLIPTIPFLPRAACTSTAFPLAVPLGFPRARACVCEFFFFAFQPAGKPAAVA